MAICSTATAQKTSFVRTIGGAKTDNNYDLTKTPDNGYVSVGYTESYGKGKKDILIVRTDALGQVLWSRAIGGTGDDVGWSIEVAPDSGFVIGGTTNSASNGKDAGLILKTDSNGATQWSITFGGDSVQDVYRVINARRGGFLAVGYVKTDTTGDDAFVAKISANGKVSWYTRCGSLGNEEAYGISEDRDNNVVITGMTTYDSITNGGKTGSAGNSDVFISKLSASGGLLWMKTYGTTTDDVGWDIQVDKNNYILAGWSSPNSDRDGIAMLTDTAGRLQYASQYGSMGDERLFNVIVRPGSKYTLVGYSDPTADRQALMIDIDASLNMQNVSMYGGMERDGHWPTKAVVNSDLGYTMLTTSNSYNKDKQEDWLLVRTNQAFEASCESIVDLLNGNAIGGISSNFFGQSSNKYGFASISLTNSTISSIPDSTLCCELVALVSRPSIAVCKGDDVLLGAEEIPGYTYKWTAQSSNFTSSEANPRISATQGDIYKLVVSASDKACKSDSATIKVSVIQRLKKDFVQDTAFCDGEKVKITAFGGLQSHSWNGNHISSSDSTITVTKTDTIYFRGTDVNSCLYLDTMISTAHELPTFNLGNDTTICKGSPILLSGPANMKSYSWNSGESNAQSFSTDKEQKHKLEVVDPNGCEGEDDIVVLTNPVSSFSLGPDTTFCEGSVFEIFGPGALSGYVWNDTTSSLQNLPITQPGTYWLKAFNSFKCPYSDTVTMKWRDVPAIDLGPDRGICRGSSFYLVAPPRMLLYTWHTGSPNDSFNVKTGGLYYVEIMDSTGCKNSDSVQVTEWSLPKISLGNDTTICDTDSLELTPGSGYAGYKWTTSAVTSTIYAKDEGVYGVTVTDNNGCRGNSSMKLDTMKCNTGSIHMIGVEDFKYYPTPASGHLNVEISSLWEDQLDLKLFDIKGALVQTQTNTLHVGANQLRVELNNLKKGLYIMRVQNKRSSASFRILIE